MKKILLCLIIVSGILQADFSRSASGVVTDNVTLLEWQDDVSSTRMTWQESIDYCEALSLDEGGWRLPTRKELVGIVDYGRKNPAINPTFENTVSNYYWSSTTDASGTSNAWYVGFNYGGQRYSYKAYNNYVRCVRAGQ